MSIINDAIKKARKEFEIRRSPGREQRLSPKARQHSEMRWTVIAVVSMVFIASLVGAMFLYGYMTRLSVSEPALDVLDVDVEPAPATPGPSVALPQIYQKSQFPTLKFDSIAELNGIVYGPEDRWAIINNKIVREGDALLNGEVKIIARDFVKIENRDGGEIILELE